MVKILSTSFNFIQLR